MQFKLNADINKKLKKIKSLYKSVMQAPFFFFINISIRILYMCIHIKFIIISFILI